MIALVDAVHAAVVKLSAMQSLKERGEKEDVENMVVNHDLGVAVPPEVADVLLQNEPLVRILSEGKARYQELKRAGVL